MRREMENARRLTRSDTFTQADWVTMGHSAYFVTFRTSRFPLCLKSAIRAHHGERPLWADHAHSGRNLIGTIKVVVGVARRRGIGLSARNSHPRRHLRAAARPLEAE